MRIGAGQPASLPLSIGLFCFYSSLDPNYSLSLSARGCYFTFPCSLRHITLSHSLSLSLSLYSLSSLFSHSLYWRPFTPTGWRARVARCSGHSWPVLRQPIGVVVGLPPGAELLRPRFGPAEGLRVGSSTVLPSSPLARFPLTEPVARWLGARLTSLSPWPEAPFLYFGGLVAPLRRAPILSSLYHSVPVLVAPAPSAPAHAAPWPSVPPLLSGLSFFALLPPFLL